MVWSGTPTASTASVPLMNGAGTLGVNTAANYRQSFIGAFITPLPGGPFSWRPGVIATTFPSGGTTHTDLLVTANGTPNTTVHVAQGNCVLVRTGVSGGPYIIGFNTSTTLTLDNADPSNPRIDTIAIRLVDQAIDGAGSLQGGYLYVVNGTAQAIPVAPTLAADYMRIADVLRPANDSVIGPSHGTITDKRKSSGVMGAVRNLLPGDALTDAGSFAGEMTVTSTGVQRYWDAANQIWRGMRTFTLPTPAQAFSGTITVGSTTTIFTSSIPDPGYPYFVVVEAACPYTDNTVGSICNAYISVDGTQVAYQSCNVPNSTVVTRTATTPTYTSSQLTGAHTVTFSLNASTITPTSNKVVTAPGDLRYSASIVVYPA